jgi:4-amino-4-deoxy-L-arabinose transferase-like glycosyltransferase
LAVLLAAIAVRLLSMSEYPLYDTTEARYAEIARLMVVSGDWVTPQIEPGVPFWAKPPLSIWLTAVSFKLFGFSELAARAPAFLLMLATAMLTFRIGKALFSEKGGIIACAILFTSAVGFIASGAVMTDAALVLTTTLCMASFCLAIRDPKPVARYSLFVGLGLGMLAKGPIALVLVAMPVFLWALWFKKLSWLGRAFPWVTGTVLMLAIAAPWYLLAEENTPGFLAYFLVGEHWLRFVESGWQGDLYGSAHSQPRGAIWIFGVAAALPWSIFALYAIFERVRARATAAAFAPIQGFLLLWALAPLLFFTLAGNILPAYVLPGLPAFALLLGDWLSRRGHAAAHAGWLFPALIAVVIGSGFIENFAGESQRGLIDYQHENSPSSTLYYFPAKPHSASFYSNGRAQSVQSESELLALLTAYNTAYIAVQKGKRGKMARHVSDCLEEKMEFRDYLLMTPVPNCDRN